MGFRAAPFSRAMTARMQERLRRLSGAMSAELEGGILPFWLKLEDAAHGAHYARMDLAGRIDRRAPKPTVFVSRLLWALSASARALSCETCLAQAERTKRFLLDRLRDPDDGAFCWSAAHDGRPLEGDKHVYAQAFAIYGLAAHALATGDEESLAAAHRLFALLEARARQADGSYGEAFDATWRPLPNRRVAPAGVDAARTMNTHLHLIEAFAGLLRVRADPSVKTALHGLLELFLGSFLASTGAHGYPALDSRLRPLAAPISWGHDIEASWLIEAAGDELGDPKLSGRLRAAAASLAGAAAAGGQCPDGGWITEAGRTGAGRVWWVQAEAVLGLVNAALRGGNSSMMDRAEASWAFIERCVVDRKGGEWFQAVDGVGRPVREELKVGPWKDPYHQVRACLEVATRLQRLETDGGAQGAAFPAPGSPPQ
jgi:mannobiose 2-epimerase